MDARNRSARRAARQPTRGLAIGVLSALLLLASAPAGAAKSDVLDRTAATTVDVLLLRPLGLIRLVAGAGLFVPATLMWPPLAGENVSQYLADPYRYLVTRPLGEDLAGN